jgi:type III secretion protein J
MSKFRFNLSVAVTALLLLGGCRDQTIYSGLAQREANEMMALLKRSGIDTKLAMDARNSTVTLAVPQQHAVAAVEALSRSGFPRVKTPTMTELLPKDTWMLSPSEERAKLAYAQSQEMMGTLRQVSGVTDVRVHFAPADRNALGQPTSQPSASVLVRYDADVIGPDYTDRIKALVANSVAGLTYDRVTVMMVPSEPAGGTPVKAISAALAEPISSAGVSGALPVGSRSAASVLPDWPTGQTGRLLAAVGVAALLALFILRRLSRR